MGRARERCLSEMKEKIGGRGWRGEVMGSNESRGFILNTEEIQRECEELLRGVEIEVGARDQGGGVFCLLSPVLLLWSVANWCENLMRELFRPEGASRIHNSDQIVRFRPWSGR